MFSLSFQERKVWKLFINYASTVASNLAACLEFLSQSSYWVFNLQTDKRHLESSRAGSWRAGRHGGSRGQEKAGRQQSRGHSWILAIGKSMTTSLREIMFK